MYGNIIINKNVLQAMARKWQRKAKICNINRKDDIRDFILRNNLLQEAINDANVVLETSGIDTDSGEASVLGFFIATKLIDTFEKSVFGK